MSNVCFLYEFRGVEFAIPPDALPSDHFQPIAIRDNSLQNIGIHPDDLLTANLSRKPQRGQFTFVRTLQGDLLGYFFRTEGGNVKVEKVCRASCCPPWYFDASEIILAAPVVRVYRHRGGVTYNFHFDERRDELWAA